MGPAGGFTPPANFNKKPMMFLSRSVYISKCYFNNERGWVYNGDEEGPGKEGKKDHEEEIVLNTVSRHPFSVLNLYHEVRSSWFYFSRGPQDAD